MNHLFRVMHTTRQSGQAARLLVFLACLLIGIRLAGEFVCYTCFSDFETPKTRTFHLHSGGDQERCHHGQADIDPLKLWGCLVNGNDSAFIVPELPHLPVVVSLFAPLVLLLVSRRNIFLIPAYGRGPPVRIS